jgi:hypothetical protein
LRIPRRFHTPALISRHWSLVAHYTSLITHPLSFITSHSLLFTHPLSLIFHNSSLNTTSHLSSLIPYPSSLIPPHSSSQALLATHLLILITNIHIIISDLSTPFTYLLWIISHLYSLICHILSLFSNHSFIISRHSPVICHCSFSSFKQVFSWPCRRSSQNFSGSANVCSLLMSQEFFQMFLFIKWRNLTKAEFLKDLCKDIGMFTTELLEPQKNYTMNLNY